MWKFFALLSALAISSPALLRAGAEVGAARFDPLEHWEFDVEAGALWRVGDGATPLNYTVLSQMLTLKSPATLRLGSVAGGDLAVRSRFSLLIEPIVAGPETFYLGASASGCLEWWNARRNFSVFFAAGGGVGWMDSRGHEIRGAQGQDLNFHWLLYPGVRYLGRNQVSVSLGLYYQHISNGGLDDINPGLNAVGPMLSVGWHF
jgi:lipid A 3-O-deacylase